MCKGLKSSLVYLIILAYYELTFIDIGISVACISGENSCCFLNVCLPGRVFQLKLQIFLSCKNESDMVLMELLKRKIYSIPALQIPFKYISYIVCLNPLLYNCLANVQPDVKR